MTKKTFIVVDSLNTFMRAKNIAARGSSTEETVAFAIHLMFSSIGKCWRDFGADHIVIATEGRSWRKEIYTPYKANRAAARAELTIKERDADAAYMEAYSTVLDFLREKTNCTVLQHPKAEADDMIARWILTTPKAHHIIVSSDSDYYQLLNENVSQYNGVTDEHITIDGIFTSRDKPVMDKKTGKQKVIGDPEWLLFEKCMRGDTSDNIFSAYPNARTKSTKNQVGLMEAYENRLIQGFAWNTVMQKTWTDHNQTEHKVGTDYLRNKHLIDLTAQPEELIQEFDKIIDEAKNTKEMSMVGLHFLKFCGKYNLQKLSENPNFYSEMLAKPY